MTTARNITSRTRSSRWIIIFAAAPWLLPSVALAAGSLDIYPTGAREAVAEHGLLGLFYLKQMWALVITFLVLIFVAHRFVFGPLIAAIDERDRQIRGALERADDISTRADAIVERHADAVTEARARAQGERESVIDGARKQSQEKIQSAQQEAESATQAMRREVERSIADAREVLRHDADTLAESIADHLLGRRAQ